jgi:hypothetical protein
VQCVWAAAPETTGREKPRLRYVSAASPEDARQRFKLHGILVPERWQGYMVVSEKPRGEAYTARVR